MKGKVKDCGENSKAQKVRRTVKSLEGRIRGAECAKGRKKNMREKSVKV